MNQNGVFERIEDACAAAEKAQKDLMLNYTVEQRQQMIDNIKKRALESLEPICKMEFEESGYGRYEDKLNQNVGCFTLSEGTEAVQAKVMTGSKGVTIDYYAPFGLVGAVTPVTNVSATLVGNSISNMAVGNGVVFNPHPSALQTAIMVIELINKAIVEVGGPDNLYVMPAKPDMKTLDYIVHYPAVKLISGPGGPNMVAALMSSGKRVIAAGPGNPPTIIDSTADLKRAAQLITESASFNNNILCIAEKEVFVLADVYDDFLKAFADAGNVLISREDADKVKAVALTPNPEGAHEPYSPVKKFVGKNANVILEAAGVACQGDPRLAIFEAEPDDPFVLTEQLMPIVPVVKVDTFEDACKYAVIAENGDCHSASIWTESLYHATTFGKMINTSVFVMNGLTMAAYGNGGEGTNTPTTATPTGEGVTSPISFARKRRFAMANGQGFVI
ncbi:MAG: aldehyde dehydrogenase [Mogibacterium sp.]|nr:aldehyde dehydrogenase [Mogibacterium sp.]